jgi:putative flippase GtrA
VHKYKLLFIQALQFGVVGLITLGIDVGVTSFMYNVVHLPAWLASSIGFCSGFFFNFPMNRKKVFKHSKLDRYSLRMQIIMVLSLSLFNLVFTGAFVEFIVVHQILTIGYAKALATAIIAAWNFVIFKFVIFSKKQGSEV